MGHNGLRGKSLRKDTSASSSTMMDRVLGRVPPATSKMTDYRQDERLVSTSWMSALRQELIPAVRRGTSTASGTSGTSGTSATSGTSGTSKTSVIGQQTFGREMRMQELFHNTKSYEYYKIFPEIKALISTDTGVPLTLNTDMCLYINRCLTDTVERAPEKKSDIVALILTLCGKISSTYHYEYFLKTPLLIVFFCEYLFFYARDNPLTEGVPPTEDVAPPPPAEGVPNAEDGAPTPLTPEERDKIISTVFHKNQRIGGYGNDELYNLLIPYVNSDMPSLIAFLEFFLDIFSTDNYKDLFKDPRINKQSKGSVILFRKYFLSIKKENIEETHIPYILNDYDYFYKNGYEYVRFLQYLYNILNETLTNEVSAPVHAYGFPLSLCSYLDKAMVKALHTQKYNVINHTFTILSTGTVMTLHGFFKEYYNALQRGEALINIFENEKEFFIMYVEQNYKDFDTPSFKSFLRANISYTKRIVRVISPRYLSPLYETCVSILSYKIRETDECGVCMDAYTKPHIIISILDACGHTYCSSCVSVIIKENESKCPKCRRIFRNVQNVSYEKYRECLWHAEEDLHAPVAPVREAHVAPVREAHVAP